jgi:hypothetical protein
MFVISEIDVAIFSNVISKLYFVLSFSTSLLNSDKMRLISFSSWFKESTFSKSPLFKTSILSLFNVIKRFFKSKICVGSLSIKHVYAPLRSIISIAESGRLLSVMYLCANSTVFLTTSVSYVTL